jgi:hypothetical protein
MKLCYNAIMAQNNIACNQKDSHRHWQPITHHVYEIEPTKHGLYDLSAKMITY